MGSDAVRVLAVEDNPADLRLLKELLSEELSTEFEVTGAGTLQDAMLLLHDSLLLTGGGFDVVLLDLNLPDSHGLEAIGSILSEPAAPPVVVLTGLDDEETGLRALSKEAQDYLVKGKIDSDSLARSIRYAIRRGQAEQAVRQLNSELEHRVQERTAELAVRNSELQKEISEREEIERQLRIQTTAMQAAANGILITDAQGKIQWTNPALTEISGYDPSELIGQNTRIFGSGWQDADFYSQMWSTIRSGQVWRGEITNRRKDGSLRVEEQTITPVLDEHGQIQHFIAIRQDISERKQAEIELGRQNVELQALTQAEHEQRQLSDALLEAARVLNKSLKLDEVLAHILGQIKDVIPYELAVVALVEQDRFYDVGHQGERSWPENLTGEAHRFPLERFPVLNKLVLTGEPIQLEDTGAEPDWITLEGLEWMRAFLAAPLVVDEQVIGFVCLFASQPGFFTRGMSPRLVGFAAQAAVAIKNARLFEQVKAGAVQLQSLSRRLVEVQENERRNVSRELHDEASQLLAALLLDVRLLEMRSAHPDAVLELAKEMESSAKAVLESLHRLAMDLRPASLDHVGLIAALRQHLDAISEKYGITIRYKAPDVWARLPESLESTLYRIVQEALTNIVRHARASSVDVVLMLRDEQLVLIVEDDGIGFDPDSAFTGEHLGLFGIRERTEMIGGTLTVESAPGRGTIIMVEVGYVEPVAAGG